jgi:hypothetical protein
MRENLPDKTVNVRCFCDFVILPDYYLGINTTMTFKNCLKPILIPIIEKYV